MTERVHLKTLNIVTRARMGKRMNEPNELNE